ncbi:MAG: bacteriohemerythrin [Terracidiphilus sp.]
MPWISWEPELSVGVKELDDDHRELIGMLNEIHATANGRQNQGLSDLVERVVASAKAHFAHEERLLDEAGYPEADAHYKEHDRMIAKALSVQAAFRCGSPCALSQEFFDFLRDWLIHHIRECDKSYGPSLNAKGIH